MVRTNSDTELYNYLENNLKSNPTKEMLKFVEDRLKYLSENKRKEFEFNNYRIMSAIRYNQQYNLGK